MGVRELAKKKGFLVEITWLDAVGYIGEDLENVKACTCRSVGWLMSVSKQSIILSSSLYKDNSGDFTIIPLGIVLLCRDIEGIEGDEDEA